MLLAIADDRIHRVFFHADLDPCITWDRETRAPERHNPRRCPVFHSESNTMTRERSIYLDSTGLVCGVMALSAVNFNLANPPGPMKGAFLHLGYASYFRIELTIAKTLGVLALLIPRIPFKVKEFAYFGFGITLISASIAHFSVGDSVIFVIDPLLFLGAPASSYSYFIKFHRVPQELPSADRATYPRSIEGHAL